jgi:hypothetical protein
MKNGRVGMADTTEYRTQIEVLAELWMDYRDDEAFAELFEYADLGFPLSYALDNGVVDSTVHAEKLIESTFDLLLKLLAVEDTGFESLNDLLDTAEQKNQK